MTKIADLVNAYLIAHRMRPPGLARQMTDALEGSPYLKASITRQAVHYWTTGQTTHPEPGRLIWIADNAKDEDLKQLAKDMLEALKNNNGRE